MESDSMNRQPLGAFYYLLIRGFFKLVIICACVVIIFAFFGVFSPMALTFSFFIALPIGIAIIGIPYSIYQKLAYNNLRYSISDNKLMYEKGILSKNTTPTLFHLIKKVNVNTPIILKMMGLAKFQFTSESLEGELILSKEEALSLQNRITTEMSVNRLTMVDKK